VLHSSVYANRILRTSVNVAIMFSTIILGRYLHFMCLMCAASCSYDTCVIVSGVVKPIPIGVTRSTQAC